MRLIFRKPKKLLFWAYYWVYFCSPFGLMAQIGGQSSFAFLQLPPNARASALGSWHNVATSHNSSFLYNPALNAVDSTSELAISYQPLYANIHVLNLSFQAAPQLWGKTAFAIQHINYGSFEQTLPNGQIVGSFQAQETAFTANYARKIGAFGAGVQLKFISSTLAQYQALALATDIGVVFKHPEQDLMFALSFHHLGGVLQEYTETSTTTLPLDIRFGIAIKPRYMPVRFSLTLHSLQQWDLSFDNVSTSVTKKNSFADNLLSHTVLGAELLIHRNFQLRFGYNHLINKTLRLEQGNSLLGFSWGIGLSIKKIAFSYARNSWQVSGGRNFLTIAFDWQSLRPFKKTEK